MRKFLAALVMILILGIIAVPFIGITWLIVVSAVKATSKILAVIVVCAGIVLGLFACGVSALKDYLKK